MSVSNRQLEREREREPERERELERERERGSIHDVRALPERSEAASPHLTTRREANPSTSLGMTYCENRLFGWTPRDAWPTARARARARARASTYLSKSA